MIYESIFDLDGNRLTNRQVSAKKDKNGIIRYNINWLYIPNKYMTPKKINEFMEDLKITKMKQAVGTEVITSLQKIENHYFIKQEKQQFLEIETKRPRKKNKRAKDYITIMGCKLTEKGHQIFKITNLKPKDEEELNGKECYLALKGKGFKIGAGLPIEWHKFRTCCPKPLDWCDENFSGKNAMIIHNCIKADISSAYGYQLTNPKLPDLKHYKMVEEFAEPTEEWPFAFYLDDNCMAIYNEGSTYDWATDRYAKSAIANMEFTRDTYTLLVKAKDYGLQSAIQELYDGRKENPENKRIMNLSVGYIDQNKLNDKYNIIGWPIRAAIIYRCNKTIIDLCHNLEENNCVPFLINTDSISWRYNKEPYCPTQPKSLGSFTLEHMDCQMVVISVKCYQIKDGDEVITRYSGPHQKCLTDTLAFGDLLKEDCLAPIREIEEKSIYKWDDYQDRFINLQGGLYNYE